MPARRRRRIPMRIGCDLDGVLADLHGRFVDAARRLFPHLDPDPLRPAVVAASPPGPGGGRRADVMPLHPDEAARTWQAIEGIENFWETLDEIEPGSVARLAALADARRWDVVFLTSRPASGGDSVQRQSQRWLAKHGFPLPSVVVGQHSRGRIAAALDLDLVIDDRPENCLEVVTESGAGAILVWRGADGGAPGSAARHGILVAPGFDAVLEALLAAEARDGRTGWLARLRSLFGSRRGGAVGPERRGRGGRAAPGSRGRRT